MQSSLRRRMLVAIPVGLVALATAASTEAASINWGAATDISGDTDVSTMGSLVGAFNLGLLGVGDTTVNGVVFTGLAVAAGGASSGDFTLTSDVSVQAFNFISSQNDPFAALTASYRGLLSTLAGTTTADPFTLTMSGLEVGQIYQFQFWDNVTQSGQANVTATAGNSTTLVDNVTALHGGLGQFAIGTFVADDSQQDISFASTNSGSINGFQLRVMPEPAGAALFLSGPLVVSLLRRRPCT